MRAGRLLLRMDPERAFDAACALEDRADRTAAETELLAALRVALRPALSVGLRTVRALDTTEGR